MALFDLKKTMKGISKAAQDVSKDVVKKAQSVDYEKLAKDVTNQTAKTVNKTVKAVKNIDVDETVKAGNKILGGMVDTIRTTKPEDVASNLGKMAESSGKAINKFFNDAAETDKAVKQALSEKEEIAEVSTEEALLVMYLMNHIDQDYSDEEKDQFDLILEESDVDDKTKKKIIKEGKAIVKKASEEDFFDVIKENVIEILNRENPSEKTISKKLFVWDLLVLAKCDEDYSDEEQRLIRAIIRTLGVDKAVFAEMESCYDAVKVLEETVTDDKKYKRELKHRRKVIQQSIYQLIEDKEV